MDKNLETFLTVAELGNLTAAAKTMNLTQPTLTKRLQQLEDQYGSPLFERLPRGVQLTQYGTQLLQYAIRIRSDYLQSHEAVRSARSGHVPRLRIGAGPLFQFRYLAPAFVILRQEFPQTQLILEGGVNSLNLPKLRDGTLDVVFGSYEEFGFDGMFEFIAVTQVETGLLLRDDHPLASGPPVEAHQLAELSWVVYSSTPDYRLQVSGYFQRQGLKPPEFALETSSYSLGMQLVAEGGFVMAAPIKLGPYIARRELTMVKTSPPLAEFSAGAYVRPSSRNLPIVRRLIDVVRKNAEEN